MRKLFIFSTRHPLFRTLAPWVVAVVIFYFLFRQYSPSQVLHAAEYANVPFFVLFSVGYFLYMWFVDCWSLAAIFTKFGVPSSPKDFFSVRFASYAIMALSYGASQGFLAYVIKKRKKISLSKAGGLLVLVASLDLYWTATIAFAASWFEPIWVRGVNLVPYLRLCWAIASLVVILVLVMLKTPTSWRHLSKVRAHDFLNSFPRAPLWKYGLAWLERFPLHLALNTSLFFTALTFGVGIPLKEVLARFPVVSVVASIPITPGGLGTSQVAIVELFRNWASPEMLLSMSLLFAFTNALLKVALGLVFLRRAAVRPHLFEIEPSRVA